MPDHCFHVMAYYDHLAENIECDHPYPAYDWPTGAQAEYDRVFARSVAYGQLAHADLERGRADHEVDFHHHRLGRD